MTIVYHACTINISRSVDDASNNLEHQCDVVIYDRNMFIDSPEEITRIVFCMVPGTNRVMSYFQILARLEIFCGGKHSSLFLSREVD